MKFHFPKRLLSAALTLALLAGLLCTSAFAAGATVNKVEEKAGNDGKITVTVYDRTPDTSVGTGAATTVSDGTPVKGVGINALCIGSVVELTTSENGAVTTQVAFGLEEAIMNTLGLEAEDAIAQSSETYYFAPEGVQTAVENVDQADLEKLAANGNKEVTGTGGVAEFTGLPYGLYLLAKSELPAEATTDFAPFLVSVPMYVEGASGTADTWNKDVYAYPKVRTDKATITKTANGNDKYVNAGETIPFTLTATIPATEKSEGATKPFGSFAITDTNTGKTLSIDTTSQFNVALKAENSAQSVNLDKTTEDSQQSGDYYIGYTNSSDGQNKVLTITFTAEGLKKLNANLDQNQTITVTYNATLNTGATFSSKLTNSATLTYDRGSDTVTVDSNDVNLYTYGIDLTKTLSDGTKIEANSGIKFKLYSDATCATEIPVVAGNNGYWRASTGDAEMEIPAGGRLYLYGLEPGTYYLKETATQTGYTLLDEPITVVITEPTAPDTNNTPTATVNNATATVDNGLVQLSVTNTKLTAGFQLPQTGGEGTLLVTAIGLGLLCAAVVLLVVYRKKSRN